MDSRQDEDCLETLIKRWHRNQCIERVLSSEISTPSDEHQGYMSRMWRVSFDVILDSGDKTTKRFIVKRPGVIGIARVWETKYGVFSREIQAYTGVLKKMESLISEHGDPKGRTWSHLYGCTQYNTLILDDLVAKGYDTVGHREALDLEESLLAISCLARFHGLGMVLLNRGDINGKNELSEPSVFFEDVLFPLLINPLRDLCQVIKTSWGSEWLSIAAKMDHLIERIPQQLNELLKSISCTINVINHGDFRTSNLLFKKDWRGRLIKCKLVDFQLVNYNSFAYDLHYFRVMAMKADVRQNNIDELLQAYHSALTETLRFYRYPSDQIPSMSQIKEELKRYSLIGFVLVPSAGAITYGEKDKMDLNLSVSVPDDEVVSSAKAYDPDIYRSKTFKDSFSREILNFIENGTLY